MTESSIRTKMNTVKLQLDLKKFIARGSFGAVYEGVYEGQKVAVKVLNFGNNHQEEALFRQEASLWSKLSHPNVVKFIGAAYIKFDQKNKKSDKRYCCMVSEYLEGGTLFWHLWRNRKKRLPLKRVIRLALHISTGLAYLHSRKVVHRDVKTNNMVLDKSGKVKLIDFGLSVNEDSEMTTKAGTEGYMAPEVCKRRPYDHKWDVFSFGICLWEIFYCRPVEIPWMKNRPRIRGDCPQQLAELMKRCWHKDSERRPEMAEVVEILKEMLLSDHVPEEAKGYQKKRASKGCFQFL